MAVNIGPKIGIDGEAEYRKELKSIIQETKTLAAETSAAAEAFKNDADNEKKAADVTEKLNKQIEAQRKLVKKLEEGVQKSAEATGENSTQTLAWKEQLAKAKTGLAALEGQTKETTEEVKDLGTAESETSDKTSVFGDVLKGNLAAAAIQKGLEITAKLVKEIGEFFIEAVKNAAEYADEISTLSKTTGLGTDTLQEYSYMAKLVDVDLSTVTGALTKLKRNMSSARDGSKMQAQAFADLGIEIVDINGNLRDSEAVFNEVLTALKQIENPTERDAAAMEIFGKSATELNPLIETSAEDLRALRNEAHDVGAVLDNETLETLNKVNDGFDRAGLTWDALKNKLGAKIGAKILPDLQEGLQILQDFAKTGNTKALTDGLMDTLKKFVSKTLPSIASDITAQLPKISRSVADKIPSMLQSLGKTAEKGLPKLAKNLGKSLGKLLEKGPEIVKAGLQLAGGLLTGLLRGLPEMVRGLGRGISGALNGPVSDAVSDAEEELDALEEKIAEVVGNTEELEQNLGKIAGDKKDAEYWLSVWDQLSKKTTLTAGEQDLLNKAVDTLNSKYLPETAQLVKDETGAWSMNREEIQRNIDTLMARAKADAYYDKIRETYAAMAEFEVQLDGVNSRIEDLSAQRDEVQPFFDRYNTGMQRMIELTNEMNVSAPEMLSDWNAGTVEMKKLAVAIGIGEANFTSWNDVTKEYSKNAQATGKTLGDINKELDIQTEEAQGLEKAIADLNLEITGYELKAKGLYDTAAEKEAFQRFYELVVKQKGQYKSTGQQLGKALGEGVYAGMTAMEASLNNKASFLMSSIVKRMKNEAQIASPSKVTEDVIGKNLALGIIKGWDDVMDPAKLSSEFSLTPAFDAMTTSMTTNTTNTTNLGGVNISVYAAEGMDINALTDAIMVKMQKAVNNRKAVFA